jgi:hypothetical protein
VHMVTFLLLRADSSSSINSLLPRTTGSSFVSGVAGTTFRSNEYSAGRKRSEEKQLNPSLHSQLEFMVAVSTTIVFYFVTSMRGMICEKSELASGAMTGSGGCPLNNHPDKLKPKI